MGDARYRPIYDRLARARDRAAQIAGLADDEVIMALAAASETHDAFLANVLATEAMNRMRRSRAITTHLAEGAFAIDAAARITFVNPSLARMLGSTWEELVGRAFGESVGLLRPDGAPIDTSGASPLREALERGAAVEWRGRMVGPGGAFPAALTIAPIVRDGDVDGVVATVRRLP